MAQNKFSKYTSLELLSMLETDRKFLAHELQAAEVRMSEISKDEYFAFESIKAKRNQFRGDIDRYKRDLASTLVSLDEEIAQVKVAKPAASKG